jgi:hypothetical protein
MSDKLDLLRRLNLFDEMDEEWIRLFGRSPSGDELTTAILVPGHLVGLAALDGRSDDSGPQVGE